LQSNVCKLLFFNEFNEILPPQYTLDAEILCSCVFSSHPDLYTCCVSFFAKQLLFTGRIKIGV